MQKSENAGEVIMKCLEFDRKKLPLVWKRPQSSLYISSYEAISINVFSKPVWFSREQPAIFLITTAWLKEPQKQRNKKGTLGRVPFYH